MTRGRVYQQDIERDEEFVRNMFANAPEPFTYQYFWLYLLSAFYIFLYLTFCDHQENKPITMSSLVLNLLCGCCFTVLVTPILTCVTFILMLIFSLPLNAFLSTTPFAFLLCCFFLYFNNVYSRKRYLKERQLYQRTSPPRAVTAQPPVKPPASQAVLQDTSKQTSPQTSADPLPAEQTALTEQAPQSVKKKNRSLSIRLLHTIADLIVTTFASALIILIPFAIGFGIYLCFDISIDNTVFWILFLPIVFVSFLLLRLIAKRYSE